MTASDGKPGTHATPSCSVYFVLKHEYHKTKHLGYTASPTIQVPGNYSRTHAPPNNTPMIPMNGDKRVVSTRKDDAAFDWDGLAVFDPDADVPLDVDEAVAEDERAVGVKTPPEGAALRQEAAAEDASCAVFGPTSMVNSYCGIKLASLWILT